MNLLRWTMWIIWTMFRWLIRIMRYWRVWGPTCACACIGFAIGTWMRGITYLPGWVVPLSVLIWIVAGTPVCRQILDDMFPGSD